MLAALLALCAAYASRGEYYDDDYDYNAEENGNVFAKKKRPTAADRVMPAPVKRRTLVDDYNDEYYDDYNGYYDDEENGNVFSKKKKQAAADRVVPTPVKRSALVDGYDDEYYDDYNDYYDDDYDYDDNDDYYFDDEENGNLFAKKKKPAAADRVVPAPVKRRTLVDDYNDEYYDDYNDYYDDEENGNLFSKKKPTTGDQMVPAPVKKGELGFGYNDDDYYDDDYYNDDYDDDYYNDDYDDDYDNYDEYYDIENDDEEQESFLARFFQDVEDDYGSNSEGYYSGEEADALASIWNEKPDFFMKHADEASFTGPMKHALMKRIKKKMKKYSKKQTKKALSKRSSKELTMIMAMNLYKKYGFPAVLLLGGLGGKGMNIGGTDNLLPMMLLMADKRHGGLLRGRNGMKLDLTEQKRLVEKLQRQIQHREHKLA